MLLPDPFLFSSVHILRNCVHPFRRTDKMEIRVSAPGPIFCQQRRLFVSPWCGPIVFVLHSSTARHSPRFLFAFLLLPYSFTRLCLLIVLFTGRLLGLVWRQIPLFNCSHNFQIASSSRTLSPRFSYQRFWSKRFCFLSNHLEPLIYVNHLEPLIYVNTVWVAVSLQFFPFFHLLFYSGNPQSSLRNPHA